MTTRSTENLIRDLAAAAAPVRRLPPPAARALAWFGFAVLYLGLVALALSPRADLAAMLRDPAFRFELAGEVVVAVVAATAAFASGVPGYPAWIRLLLTLVPLAWLGWFGGTSVLAGLARPAEVAGWECLPALLVFAGVPVIGMALLLRRAAPLTPGRTLVQGALAAGALADVGVRLCHSADAAGHLVWHLGAVVLLVVAAARAAPSVLQWRAAGA